MEKTLIFGADIVPTESNEQSFIQGDVEHLVGNELLKDLSNADFRCFNLECPLTSEHETVFYPGPHLMAKPETIRGIKNLNPSLLTIGNNHALDQGENGLKSTIHVLKSEGIPYIGAGENLEKASEPYYLSSDEGIVGVFNCSEYECSAATENKFGANHYDPLVSFDQVKSIRQRCDVLIVLYHGGKEFYRYPSPQLQRICRKFVEYGADVVICQHTHCIGCKEEYNGSTIIYGQGNFIFDYNENEYKKTGVLVKCIVENKRVKEIGYIPFVKVNECIRKANDEEKNFIFSDFEDRNKRIMMPGFINKEYEELAKTYYKKYVFKIVGMNRFVRIMNKMSGGRFPKRFFDKKGALAILNIFATENHNELALEGLRLMGKDGF